LSKIGGEVKGPLLTKCFTQSRIVLKTMAYSLGGDWKREFLHKMFIESKTPLSSKSYFSLTHTLPSHRRGVMRVTSLWPRPQRKLSSSRSFHSCPHSAHTSHRC